MMLLIQHDIVQRISYRKEQVVESNTTEEPDMNILLMTVAGDAVEHQTQYQLVFEGELRIPGGERIDQAHKEQRIQVPELLQLARIENKVQVIERRTVGIHARPGKSHLKCDLQATPKEQRIHHRFEFRIQEITDPFFEKGHGKEGACDHEEQGHTETHCEHVHDTDAGIAVRSHAHIGDAFKSMPVHRHQYTDTFA